jgi:hypothetical protein
MQTVAPGTGGAYANGKSAALEPNY